MFYNSTKINIKLTYKFYNSINITIKLVYLTLKLN